MILNLKNSIQIFLYREFYDQMLQELCRYQGKDLQGSMSNILEHLIGTDVFAKFCYSGSKTKKSFKKTNVFRLLQDVLFETYDNKEATMELIKEKLKNKFRNTKKMENVG
ncbi:hypothetical protein ACFFRR_005718 [Megaselia abdita]